MGRGSQGQRPPGDQRTGNDDRDAGIAEAAGHLEEEVMEAIDASTLSPDQEGHM